jgi:thymidylate kinase
MLLPTDGATSLLLQVWGEKQSIPLTCLDADWVKLGKRARALRDARILKESTHLILFLGKRSDTYEKVAIRECKKGKVVYTISSEEKELVEWRLEP